MGPKLVQIAADAAERLVDQSVARENAREAATALARKRVERLEVEHFLERHVGAAWGSRPVSGRHQPSRAGRVR